MRTRTTLPTIALALFLAVGSAAAQTADPKGSYKLDAQHCYAVFKVQHLGLNWSFGTFHQMDGTYTLDPANPGASSFTIQVAADSLDTGVEKRDQHLRSPDFFNVKQFPQITFQSKKVEKTDKGFRVTGDFTLLGVTKPLTVDVAQVGAGQDPWGNFRTGLYAEFTIKRSDFGMKWGIDNGVVGDEVHLTLSVEGVRQ